MGAGRLLPARIQEGRRLALISGKRDPAFSSAESVSTIHGCGPGGPWKCAPPRILRKIGPRLGPGFRRSRRSWRHFGCVSHGRADEQNRRPAAPAPLSRAELSAESIDAPRIPCTVEHAAGNGSPQFIAHNPGMGIRLHQQFTEEPLEGAPIAAQSFAVPGRLVQRYLRSRSSVAEAVIPPLSAHLLPSGGRPIVDGVPVGVEGQLPGDAQWPRRDGRGSTERPCRAAGPTRSRGSPLLRADRARLEDRGGCRCPAPTAAWSGQSARAACAGRSFFRPRRGGHPERRDPMRRS